MATSRLMDILALRLVVLTCISYAVVICCLTQLVKAMTTEQTLKVCCAVHVCFVYAVLHFKAKNC